VSATRPTYIALRRGYHVNKADITDAVADKLDMTKRDVNDVVEAFHDEIKRALARGERVSISGFGVYESVSRKARLGRNPRTGETVKIKATKLPKFRAGAELKGIVAGNKKVASAPAKKAAKKAPAKKATKRR
jgi:DNA-binding protein HU-beta